MTLFSRRQTWLYQALDLNEPKIPVDLDTEIAQSTVDILQGGQGLVENVEIEFDFIENQAENDVAILDQDFDRVRIIHFVECFNSAATTWFWNCFLRRPSGLAVRISDLDVLTMATAGTQQLLPAGRVWIPPGFQFRVFFSATGPGDTRRFSLYAQAFRFGFNPNY